MTIQQRLRIPGLGVMLLLVAVCGCGPGGGGTPLDSGGGGGLGGGTAVMALQSSAFVNNGPIPTLYTVDGANTSPPLSWSGLPAGTQELAVIVEDLDAINFFQWVIYSIPVSSTGLPAAIPRTALVSNPLGAVQGLNSALTVGWTGPNPPTGLLHRYQFTLYALDAKLVLSSGLTAQQLQSSIQTKTIGTAQLVGTYLH